MKWLKTMFRGGEADTKKRVAPPAGRFAQVDQYDRFRMRSSAVTPERAGRYLSAADSGDIAQIAWAASQISIENWDIRHALETRRNAVTSCKWSIAPGDPEDARCRAAAEALEEELRACGGMTDAPDGFGDLLDDLLDAIVCPFAASEIVWAPGGKILGFKRIDPWTFSFRDSERPRLITDDAPSGIEIPEGKLQLHSYRRGGDPVRRGLVRTLLWLHVFQNFPIKDLLAFVERFGMPFIAARVDAQTFESDRDVLNSLIRAYGPNGGGVFGKGVELDLLQANAGGGEVYFKLLAYTGDAITKTILGQLASSATSSGLSGGDAQSSVRDDIREADARALENSINSGLIKTWSELHAPGVPAPRLVIDAGAPEDLLAFADLVGKLHVAGFKTDLGEVSERVGLTLRMDQPTAPVDTMSDQAAVSADTLNLKQKYDAIGVAIRAGILTATPEIEEMTRHELGLPALPEAARKAWDATGGIRQPITLKAAEAAAVEDALDVQNDAVAMAGEGDDDDDDSIPDAAAVEALKNGAIARWLGPFYDEIDAVSEADDEKFGTALAGLADVEKFGDSRDFEEVLTNTSATAMVAGANSALKKVKARKVLRKRRK